MKRGVSGKARRGSPPLPRQRMALRVVQITLVALALMLALLAYDGLRRRSEPPPSTSVTASGPASVIEVAGLAAGAVLSAGAALAMGVRTVRGPRPPSLD